MSGNETYAIYLYADGLIHWSDFTEPIAGYCFENDTIFTVKDEDMTLSTNIGYPGVWVLRLDKVDFPFPEEGTKLL